MSDNVGNDEPESITTTRCLKCGLALSGNSAGCVCTVTVESPTGPGGQRMSELHATAFPFDYSHCANCGAPTKRVELENPPKEGMWVQQYDPTRTDAGTGLAVAAAPRAP